MNKKKKNSIFVKGGGYKAFWYDLGYMSYYTKNKDIESIGGYSAGSIVAALSLCTRSEKDEILNLCRKLVSEFKYGKLSLTIRELLEELLPEDAHDKVKNKLDILVCDPGDYFKGKMESKWSTREDLINDIVSSCYVPFISEFRLKDGITGYLDGGLCRDIEDIIKKYVNVVEMKGLGYIDVLRTVSSEKALEYYEEGVENCKEDLKNELKK